jgi:hypothetical protein
MTAMILASVLNCLRKATPDSGGIALSGDRGFGTRCETKRLFASPSHGEGSRRWRLALRAQPPTRFGVWPSHDGVRGKADQIAEEDAHKLPLLQLNQHVSGRPPVSQRTRRAARRPLDVAVSGF